jgi:hypothetical protein
VAAEELLKCLEAEEKVANNRIYDYLKHLNNKFHDMETYEKNSNIKEEVKKEKEVLLKYIEECKQIMEQNVLEIYKEAVPKAISAPSMRLLAEKTALLDTSDSEAGSLYIKALELASGEFYCQIPIAVSIAFYLNDKEWAVKVLKDMVANCFKIEEELLNEAQKGFNELFVNLKEGKLNKAVGEAASGWKSAVEETSSYKHRLDAVKRVKRDLLEFAGEYPLFREAQILFELIKSFEEIRNKRGFFNKNTSLIHLAGLKK